ncbi:hypothetical protein NPIL_321231 [Nephila pilipes]|uniref:Uncharacterized protein n=1 Tax=Nephila pilipes TaxID=299642 RepID=A0A8X6NCM3_NEPPI|nr:hypothetical protein NPIL_321231 [Nephila pilipes]
MPRRRSNNSLIAGLRLQARVASAVCRRRVPETPALQQYFSLWLSITDSTNTPAAQNNHFIDHVAGQECSPVERNQEEAIIRKLNLQCHPVSQHPLIVKALYPGRSNHLLTILPSPVSAVFPFITPAIDKVLSESHLLRTVLIQQC